MGAPFSDDFWLSDDFVEDPYGFYEELRTTPVRRIGDDYLVSRYEDVRYVFEHPELFSNNRDPVPATVHGEEIIFGQAVSDHDPPAHEPYRRIALESIRSKRILSYRSKMEEVANRLIDGFIERGSAELCDEFAMPYQFQVKSAILGFPAHAEEQILRWSADFLRYRQIGRLPNVDDSLRQRLRVSVDEFATFMYDLVEDRRQHPADDILTDIVHHERASEVNVVGIATSLLLGGSVAARNALASLMVVLLSRPELGEVARLDPTNIDSIFDEVVRWETPAQFLPRRVVQDVELSGITMPAGSRILLVLAAANRDPSVYDRPGDVCPERQGQPRSMTFGHGIHSCVGIPLIRIETRVAVHALMTRLTDLAIDPTRPVGVYPLPSERGPAALPVTFRVDAAVGLD